MGTFLRSSTFGHVRQLEAVAGQMLAGARAAGAGPGPRQLAADVDSTICEVHGHAKAGSAYGYTEWLGYHPIVANRADTARDNLPALHTWPRDDSCRNTRTIDRELPRLVDGGDPNVVAADLLGHSPDMLMGTNAHVLPESVRTVTDKIGQRADGLIG